MTHWNGFSEMRRSNNCFQRVFGAMAVLQESRPLCDFTRLLEMFDPEVRGIQTRLTMLQTPGTFDERIVPPASERFRISFIEFMMNRERDADKTGAFATGSHYRTTHHPSLRPKFLIISYDNSFRRRFVVGICLDDIHGFIINSPPFFFVLPINTNEPIKVWVLAFLWLNYWLHKVSSNLFNRTFISRPFCDFYLSSYSSSFSRSRFASFERGTRTYNPQ